MELLVLGPLSVGWGGRTIEVGRPKVRLLLALLAIHANRVVSTERLIDCLWGDSPVPSARSNLKTYVSALRAALSPDAPSKAPIRTAPNGYAIDIDTDGVDAIRFERLIARAGDAARRGAEDVRVSLLESALTLWRGRPFEDVQPSCDLLDATICRFEELRLGAVEDLLAARLAAGRHSEALRELRGWVTRHPLRERLWEQLMLALYRDGRQAEALRAYQRLRERLTDEIGMEPSVPVRDLHSRILKADPSLLARGTAATVPHQLPLDVETFVGRGAELTDLNRILARGSPVVVVHGPAGAGKSALVIRAAGNVSRFPDGELYVNLHGASPGVAPLTAAECLGRFLRALGVSVADVPQNTEEAAALYRSLIANRRMLVVLDNASSVGQVSSLLPGGGGTNVIITSRRRLATLPGATHLEVRPLAPDDARLLVERLVDGRGLGPQVRKLAALCDHLPLAIHLAATRLRNRPGWTVADLVDRLCDPNRRLAELAVGEVCLRSSIEVSHSALLSSADDVDQEAARALMLMGVLRLRTIDVATAAALLGRPADRAERVLERLADAHLLEVDDSGRFSCYDLVGLCATEAAAEASRNDISAAVGRVVAYYAAAVQQPMALVDPQGRCGLVASRAHIVRKDDLGRSSAVVA
ncbi:BTAD domain-containing putative transcriptional regulator [Asanoa sp. NPDC049573]|uniref:AfsR/SARP family transcriptional regulator n=1 Tax=Asanoa sp. NPDC049573 TaxID=3155396 RepID=UPI00344352EB